ISSSTAGKCHDAGATRPTSGQVIGQVLTTNVAAGTYTINIALGTSNFAGGAIASNLNFTETTAPSGASGHDLIWGDSTAHRLKMNNNNGGAVQVIGSGADINTSDQVTLTHLASPLPAAQGGTGATTLTGILQGNGTSAFTPATATNINSPLFCSDAGASDTYACNLSPAIASYATGTHYRFKANTANT